MTGNDDHDALLTLARTSAAAARDDDRERLEAATLRLFEALVEHLAAERPDLVHLPPGDARRVSHGQQRVVESVVARLTVQSDDERRWFFPPTPGA